MAVTPTYPGIYIEEISSGVRTITGVATSIAAFVDTFERGLLNRPVRVFNFGDFAREFGGLDSRSEASYAIQQFFLNGGTEAWVVRVAGAGAVAASTTIQTALTVEAGRFNFSNPGRWGDRLRINIDYPTPTSGDRFNMTVILVELRNGEEVIQQSETFRNLSMNPVDTNFVRTIVNDEFAGSKLVRVTATGTQRPLPTGTLSGVLNPFPTITNTNPEISVTIGTVGQGIARLASVPTSLTQARQLLESAIRGARPELKAFAQATVSVVDNRLRILAGPVAANSQVTFSAATDASTLSSLGLANGTSLQGVLSEDLSGAFPVAAGQLQVTIGSSTVTLSLGDMADLAAARTELESQIRAAAGNPAVLPAEADAFANARVVTYTDAGSQHLIVLSGLPETSVSFSQEGTETTVDDLGLNAGTATAITAFVSNEIAPIPAVAASATVNLAIGGLGPHTATITTAANDLSAIATQLQTAIRNADPGSSSAFTGTRVASYEAGENRLLIIPDTSDTITFTAGTVDNITVTQLLLDATNAQVNVQSYELSGGADGNPADGNALMGGGDPNAKAGIYALEDVDLFNILCIPRAAVLAGDSATETEGVAVMTVANNYCQQRRAFFIMDTPPNIDEVAEINNWLDRHATLRNKNAALYFPRVYIPDPLNNFKLRSVGASGTIAGLFARTDSTRGVWKAPAGTDATLRNVAKLEIALTDQENGVLNPLGINCLRTFPVYGSICWGARTLNGADQQASEWKYIPVVRVALFIEETLYRGLKWVVFEPNDEPLWSQIRLNVGAFMQNLFRQGAFQGKSPREAYLVKCDKETTTQNDINLGIVNIVVGFAPLKPAEFVIIKIQQLAGQIQV
ncbi:hypothetical protein ACX27_08580 [Nostoc piscinale CENA21]|uniref:Tail protein n=1 Tax=Nostoc piscinale CENA21 TaxID=224013 RepID=A0A0M4TV93_9NOSO|nr:phage tail sheath subtilisin-like domain-containing protein [Nostoc piscinale]ALF52901.1 hypothetical protein ACX27_08580 [Nostoc piscinale CENA21]